MRQLFNETDLFSIILILHQSIGIASIYLTFLVLLMKEVQKSLTFLAGHIRSYFLVKKHTNKQAKSLYLIP